MTQGELQIRVLGPISVCRSGTEFELGGRRQRTLLAALAVGNGAVVSAEKLAERLWGDGAQPVDPRASLHTYLSRLRQTLEADAAIETVSSGWRLNDRVIQVDAARFTELVEAADEPGVDVHRRLGLLDEALGLWRGDAFEEVAGKDWARAEVDRLNELRVTAIERRYDAMLSAGMHTDALPGLVGEVEAHPLRDRLVGLQMLALFRSGRGAEATRAFQAHRENLAEELGLEPGSELVELDRRIVVGDPSLLLTETPGRALRGYRLGEQLGEGAFAVVYRGTQPSVGRDVAVKIIRAELANRPEFVRRFEAEAHLVARLEHPFIVPLYDYWREPDRAYLVFRFLRGGTLEQRLSASGGLSVAECRTMVDEVGAALSAAHGAGVVHRDVKPANVLLDEAGNFYLGDFGIALEAAELSDPSAALSAGSPAYASPEQLRREPIGPSADVHGLGISIYEALTGRLPFPSAISKADLLQRQLHDPIPLVRDRRPDVPAGVDEVLAKATSKDPADRYQTIDELVAEFAAALDAGPAAIVRAGAATTVSVGEARNPYKGLRAFTEADSTDFYGRERLVDRLVEVLARTGTEGRIAAVVGPSGIGKSSVVRAGLLPALRNGAVAGSDRWFVATMLPGRDPFDELAAALLRVATRAPDNMMGQLAEDHRGIARVVKAIAPDDDLGDVLLVIDQFEELFTLAEDDKVTRLFLDGLEHALTDARCRLRVVLTMRADFWDRPLRHGAFARLIDASTVTISALAPDELERAIVEPAHRSGAEFEPGLVSEIMADLTDQPGALPLLQYALTELWEQQVSGLLTRDAYHQLGGVAGALTRRAEDLYLDATPEEQAAVRPLFGRLVTPGEGTEDTRRRALRAELGASDEVGNVIDRYGQARLLSFDTDPTTREPTVEVAHEALIRQWPRLRTWLDEDRDGLRVLRHLSASADGWDSSSRPDADLYRGGRLEGAEEWAVEHGDELTKLERAFLLASTGLRSEEEQEERQRFERQARDNRRLKTLLSAVAVIGAVALIAGVVAIQQRSEANDNAGRAETERIAAEAGSFAGEDLPLSLLLAVEAHDRDPGAVGLGALQTALSRSGSFLGFTSIESADAVHWIDQETLLASGPQGVSLVNWRTGSIASIAETPVYQRVFVVGDGNTRLITMADVSGGTIAFARAEDPTIAEVRNLDGDLLSTIQATGPIDAVAVSEQGLVLTLDLEGWLIATGSDGIERWRRHAHPEALSADIDFGDLPVGTVDLTFGLPVPPLPWPRNRRPQLVEIVDGSTEVLTVESELIRRWDLSSGEALPVSNFFVAVNDAGDPVLSPIDDLSASPDGTRFVAAVRHQIFGRPVVTEELPRRSVLQSTGAMYGNPKGDRVEWFDDDRALVLFSDGRLALVHWSTGNIDRVIDTGLTRVTDMAVSSDHSLIAVTGSEGLGVWSLTGSGLIVTGVPRLGVHMGSILSDGSITTNYSQWVPEGWSPGPWWDPADDVPRQIDAPDETDNEPMIGIGLPWSDSTFGGLTFGFEPVLYDVETRQKIASLDLPGFWVGQAGSPDLRTFAFGTDTGVAIFDRTGARVADLPEAGGYSPSMGFSADGEHLAAVGVDGSVHLYLVDGWKVLDSSAFQGESVRAVRFSPDGTWLVAMLTSGDIQLRKTDTLRIEKTLVGAGEPLVADSDTFAFSEDGRFLITTGDASSRLWDLDAGVQIGEPFPNDPDFRMGVSDGLQLLTARDDFLLLWDLDMTRWSEIACAAAGRNLTRPEWEQFGPADQEYSATCQQWPIDT